MAKNTGKHNNLSAPSVKKLPQQRIIVGGVFLLVLNIGLQITDAFWDSVIQTEVSENVSSPSSGFLMVKGFHSCVTVESLLPILSTEGHYLWSKNTVFWDAIKAVSIIDGVRDFVQCTSSSIQRFRERIGSIFRVPQLCCC
jgi:hypothetical protein